MNINMALGHHNEDSTGKTARELGWVLTHGTSRPCKHCTKSKAKQKNVQKEAICEKAEWSGHRIYLDLSKVTLKSSASEDVTINRENWKIMVCKATGKKWSDFTVTKGEMVERTCEHLNKLKS